MKYRIAFSKGPSWEVMDWFEAESDDAATVYAKHRYRQQKWHVLNHSGYDINARRQEEAL